MDRVEDQIEKDVLNKAATRIQATYRGFKARRGLYELGDENDTIDEVSERKRAKTDPALPSAEAFAKEVSHIDHTDPAVETSVVFSEEDLIQVASQQPHCLSVFTRSQSDPGSIEEDINSTREEDIIDTNEKVTETRIIDALLNDPNTDLTLDPVYMNNAATRIQANVRGFLTRKSFKHQKRPKTLSGN